MPEKFPVQEQVDDEQRYENKTCVVMQRNPLIAGDAKVRYPAATPPAAFREDEIQHKPGGKRQNEHDQGSEVYESVCGYTFHVAFSLSCPASLIRFSLPFLTFNTTPRS